MSTGDALDPLRLREAFSHLPTGVTLVTATTPEGPVGMAVNSFTSVSLDPPLALICPARTSSTWPSIRAAGRFCVNVLAAQHAELARRFAARGVDRFQDVDYELRAGAPVLPDALAWLACEIEHEHDAGDHTIVVARISDLGVLGDADPLVFYRREFGTYAASRTLFDDGSVPRH